MGIRGVAVLASAVICAIFAGPAAAQTATLIIHNNTGATLTVFTQNAFSTGIESAEAVAAPESVVTLKVPMGQSNVWAVARGMADAPSHVRTFNFSHSGRHEIEIFASDFGLTAMFDAPGAETAGPQEAVGTDGRPVAGEGALARLGAMGTWRGIGRTRVCPEPASAPFWYELHGLGSCPEGFVPGIPHPDGDARYCGFCGAAYGGELDANYCCQPSG